MECGFLSCFLSTLMQFVMFDKEMCVYKIVSVVINCKSFYILLRRIQTTDFEAQFLLKKYFKIIIL
jgi:hypothetical protein